MVMKKNISYRIFDSVNTLFMILMAIITLYPFYYVIICSISDATQLISARGALLAPQGISLSAYKAVLSNPNILTGYRSTLIIVVFGTAFNLLMTSLGAFLITRKGFAIKRVMGLMMVFTMYFSGGMIPSYLLVFKYLHLGDTLWALIIPTAISTYNLIIMKTNFEAIPDSIEESAKIDGANDVVIFARIIMPLSMPIIAVMILFYGVSHWNSWFNAMIYLRTRTKFPLQLILREILLMDSTDSMSGSDADSYAIAATIKYATIMIATVPILCVYPFIQKYFVKGIMIGAVKG